jgi:hypothetical protein
MSVWPREGMVFPQSANRLQVGSVFGMPIKIFGGLKALIRQMIEGVARLFAPVLNKQFLRQLLNATVDGLVRLNLLLSQESPLR